MHDVVSDSSVERTRVRRNAPRSIVGLVLVTLVALHPTNSLSEAAYAFGQWGNGAWAYGSGYNYQTQSEAQASAMNLCNQRGYNCAVRGSFRKMCFAIAVQDNNNGFHAAQHYDPNVANRQALIGCARMGQSCSIREEFCDSVSEADVRAAEQAEYQQYVQNWHFCFGNTPIAGGPTKQIEYCDYALGFSRASPDDRGKLVNQRSALVESRDRQLADAARAAASAQQSKDDFQPYELSWRHCLDSSVPADLVNHQIDSCDEALGYPRGTAEYRSSLRQQLDRLIEIRRRVQAEALIERPAADERRDADAEIDYTKWSFTWLGFFHIMLVMQHFAAATLIAVTGWYGLARRLTQEIIGEGNLSLTAWCSGALLAGGLLLAWLQYLPALQRYEGYLFLFSFGADIFGSSLAALAIGMWVGAILSTSKLNLRFRALVPIWIAVAVAWMAFLLRETVYASRVDHSIIIGVTFAWIFVLGYLLTDPVIIPATEKLDQLVQWTVSKFERAIAGWRSQGRSSGRIAEQLSALRSAALQPYAEPNPDSIAIKTKRYKMRKGLGRKTVFVLDARMEVSHDIRKEIDEYRLGRRVIYDSLDRKRHTEASDAAFQSTKDHPGLRESFDKQMLGIGKTLYRFALAFFFLARAGLSVRVTVYSLIKGAHIACEDLGELLKAETAIENAGAKLRAFINEAREFDGREQISEY
jgi:Domain of unknown function (DUF4189)